MNISLQELYWIVMMAFGLIATAINVVLYHRNKPDKIKAAIASAIEPLVHRLEVVERNQTRQDTDIKLVNTSITRLEGGLKHLPQREEFTALSERLTDMVGIVGQLQGASSAEAALLGRINHFLLERGG